MTAIKKYTEKRFSHLKKLLRKYAAEANADTLHGIRVDVKKIKVILQLINSSVAGFHAHRHFIPLRDIFRMAGRIRQPQVFYELLLRHEIQGVDDAHVPGSGRQAGLSKRFQRAVPEYLLTVRTQKKKLGKFLGKIKEKQVRKYIKARREALMQIFQGQISGSSLHKSRKVMKEILYLDAAIHTGGRSRKNLGKLEELVGQWHDQQLLSEVLTKARHPERFRIRLERDAAKGAVQKAIADFYRREA